MLSYKYHFHGRIIALGLQKRPIDLSLSVAYNLEQSARNELTMVAASMRQILYCMDEQK